MTIRTRFSPSPTGKIHLGNARAALFSALYAAKHNGVFILRIEDTDAARSEEMHVDSLKADLKWLGIDWQEGPDKTGEYGPYWQSQRQDIYQQYYKFLEEHKHIYPCFCTDQELNLARKLQLSRGQAPRYSGTCLNLSEEEIKARINDGKKPAWRFIVPSGQTVEFVDAVKGLQQFKTDDIGDFIVRRADGTAPFLFCNAIDDALMKVSHVLRGEDHLTNTPRQILILKTLKLTVPLYGHLSLIVGEDGSPLSKRHGSFSVHELRATGYLPSAIINYLARLGHSCDVPQLLSFHDFAPHFQIEKLSRSAARFDLSQLMYWQKMAVGNLSVAEVWDFIGETVTQVPADMHALFAETVRANIVFPKDALQWAQVFFEDVPDINESGVEVLKQAGEQYFLEAERAFQQFGIDLKLVFAEMKQTLKIEGKKLFMPMRIALTGENHGPELIQVVKMLGEDKIKKRLEHANKLIKKSEMEPS